MTKKPTHIDDYPPEEIVRRRDETLKRMIAASPKTQKGAPKRASQSSPKGKRGS